MIFPLYPTMRQDDENGLRESVILKEQPLISPGLFSAASGIVHFGGLQNGLGLSRALQ